MADFMDSKKGTRRRLAALVLIAALPVVSACQTTSQLDKAALAPPPKPKVVVTPQMVESAETALIEGRLKEAHQGFARIYSADPKNTDAKIGLGEVFLASGNWKQALAVFRDLAGHKEMRAVALQGEGLALLRARKVVAAKHKFKEALAVNGTLWRSWNGLGQCQDRLGEFAAAGVSYDKAIGLSPETSLVYNNLGYSLMLQGRHKEAEAKFLKALEKDPRMKVAQSNLRLSLAWQGRYFEAMAGTPIRQRTKILNNVGFVAMLRGDYQRAEAYLTRAMDGSASFYDVAWRNMEALRAMAPRKAPAQTSMLNDGAVQTKSGMSGKRVR